VIYIFFIFGPRKADRQVVWPKRLSNLALLNPCPLAMARLLFPLVVVVIVVVVAFDPVQFRSRLQSAYFVLSGFFISQMLPTELIICKRKSKANLKFSAVSIVF